MSVAEKSRRYPRIELPRGFLVAWRCAGQQDVSRVRTVGMGGLFLQTSQPPPTGSVVTLLFDLPDGEVRARATVRDSRPGEGMGLEFNSMAFEARARLHQVLKRLLQ